MQNKERLEQIIGNLFGKSNIDKNSTISEIVGNSMGYIKFIVAIESEFDIEFEDEILDITYFEDIGQLISYLQEHIN